MKNEEVTNSQENKITKRKTTIIAQNERRGGVEDSKSACALPSKCVGWLMILFVLVDDFVCAFVNVNGPNEEAERSAFLDSLSILKS